MVAGNTSTERRSASRTYSPDEVETIVQNALRDQRISLLEDGIAQLVKKEEQSYLEVRDLLSKIVDSHPKAIQNSKEEILMEVVAIKEAILGQVSSQYSTKSFVYEVMKEGQVAVLDKVKTTARAVYLTVGAMGIAIGWAISLLVQIKSLAGDP